MKDSIYTIPISEVFEPKDTCPFCRLHDTLETRAVDTVMGAAMMEPDIRMQTNKLGFCSDHFKMMLAQKNRLSLALLLESHLDELIKGLPTEKEEKGGKADIKAAKSAAEGCYVCAKVNDAMEMMISNMFKMWSKEQSFKKLYAEQPCLCLNHYTVIVDRAPKFLSKKELPEFLEVTGRLTKEYLLTVKDDVSHFCRMFDYRNSGPNADWGNSKTAVERAVWYLTSKRPE